MNYLNNNITEADCLIVALYNALVLHGQPRLYSEIKELTIAKRWYSEKNGFKIRYLHAFFNKYNLQIIPTVAQITTKTISNRIGQGENFLLISNGYYPGERGHAMLATKGKNGTKVVNCTYRDSGWKTFRFHSKHNWVTFSAYEIRKAS